MEGQRIDRKNLVASLEAGLGSRHSGLDLADADGVVLHAGHKTHGVKVEVVRSVGVGNHQLRADALPITPDIDGDDLSYVEPRADRDLLPGRVGDIIEASDDIARLKSGRGSGGVIRNKVDIGRLGTKGFHLVMHHVKASHEQQSKQEDRYRTRQTNENALPAGMGVELSRITGGLFTRRFSRHFDVAAKGQEAEPVISVPVAETEKTFAETHREDFDPHAA